MTKQTRKELEEIILQNIENPLISEAVKEVDRRLFVPDEYADYAYLDEAIRLNKDSSISQPSLVARMIDLLNLNGDERVLEIGTASGYSAAVLSLCCREVDTIEINPKLAKTAEKRLKKLGFNNITVHTGNGYLGLSPKSPFDSIIVTAAAKEIPKSLVDQLKEGGRIIIPMQIEGSDMQELVLGLKEKNKLIARPITIVKFVPLVKDKK